jgi:glycerol-3-phosphate dehydrogenase
MKTRSQVLEIASLREFDLLVIGGGIVGAGIAQDAASRGMSVLLVEKEDFASGSSGRTSKLIHGSLPQLQKVSIKQGRDLSQEQSSLAQLAPHLIRDFACVLPIKKQKKISGWKAKLGLTLFDLVAGSKTETVGHHNLTQKELSEAAPALSSGDLTGGIRFHDFLTDDARLVMEVLKSAIAEGAHAINYVEAKSFTSENGRVTSVQCRDRYSGEQYTFRCRACVSAVGVWTDELLKSADESWQRTIPLGKQTHLLLPMSAFETNNALILPAKEEGRHVSIVPWERALLVGATQSPYTGNINNPLPAVQDIDYLIDCINNCNPVRKVTRNDVIASWSSLFPIIGQQNAMAPETRRGKSTTPREYHIVDGPLQLTAVYGGELESYRLVSEEVVDRVLAQAQEKNIALPKGPSRTKRLMLGGWKDKDDFLTQTAAIAAKARKHGIEPATLDHLIASYGIDAQLIVDLVERQPALSERLCPDFPPIMAEAAYSIVSEMCVSLEDLLFRRIRLGLLHQMQCKGAAAKVASLMQSLLNWDDARAALELQTLEKLLDAHIEAFRAVAFTQSKSN